MSMQRRDIARAGAAALLGAAILPNAASAQAADEQRVAQSVEALRVAMVEPTRPALEALCAAQLSYGHSAGRMETKQQFVDSLVNRTSVFRSINQTEQTIAIAGNAAIVRHLLTGETATGGTIAPVRIGVLQIWQKQGETWLLLARQSFRL